MIVNYSPELFPHVLAMATAMRDEGEFKNRSINPAKFAALLESKGVFCALCMEGNEYIGGIIACITPQFFGDDLIAQDMGLYVKPEHRGGTAAVRLAKAYEIWATTCGAKEIYLSQSTGCNIERTSALYEKMGYHIVGFLAKKET